MSFESIRDRRSPLFGQGRVANHRLGGVKVAEVDVAHRQVRVVHAHAGRVLARYHRGPA